MNTIVRTGVIAIGALIIGGLAVYGYEESEDISITSTSLAMHAPAGKAALTHSRVGIGHLDAAAAAVGSGDFDTAASALEAAKTEFRNVADAAPTAKQPITVAQEAIIVNRFSPDPPHKTFGKAGANGDEKTTMTLSRGGATTTLALQDYTIDFGDLNINTQHAITHIDDAITAAISDEKAKATDSIQAARRAITFTVNGEELEEI